MKRQAKSGVDQLRLRKRNGKLAFPELHCGPGPVCQQASGASVDLIRSILSDGTTPADAEHCKACQDKSVHSSLLEI